jgi:hypothetical protein
MEVMEHRAPNRRSVVSTSLVCNPVVPEDDRARLPRDLHLAGSVTLFSHLVICCGVVLLLFQVSGVGASTQRIVLQLKRLPKPSMRARVNREATLFRTRTFQT